ncbi:uncharacterized protein TNCV_3566411 [Trichonephila clavipes]|nr:uncharacterized protein TNCV_3566411 [Trichonephila clavipes]
MGCTTQGVPGVRKHQNLKSIFCVNSRSNRRRARGLYPPSQMRAIWRFGECWEPKAFSTLSCAACARLESNRPSASCRFFMMVPPTIDCNQILPYTCYSPMNAVSRQCVGQNYPLSFDRAISSAKAPGRRNAYGIRTRGASSSTTKCSIQHKGSYVWFQHDGMLAHFSADLRSSLDTAYPGRWIGRGGPVNWRARSPDLSCIDFCLQAHMKSLVYASPVKSDEALVARIAVVAGDIREMPGVFANVLQSFRQLCEA